MKLSEWKIAAIKMAIILERRAVTRADFRALKMSPTRWLDPRDGWLTRCEDGYVATPRLPDFRAQHPVNYQQIRDDAPKWLAKLDDQRKPPGQRPRPKPDRTQPGRAPRRGRPSILCPGSRVMSKITMNMVATAINATVSSAGKPKTMTSKATAITRLAVKR